MPSTHTPTADTTNNKMATYSTIPAAEEPLVAKPQGKSLKALVAGAAVASWRDADGRAVELDELDDLDASSAARSERSEPLSNVVLIRGHTCKKDRAFLPGDVESTPTRRTRRRPTRAGHIP